METKVISDRQISHNCERGLRIIRTQVVSVDGKLFQCDFWAEWSDPKHHIHHVDSRPIDEFSTQS